jgi:hypothetical protein
MNDPRTQHAADPGQVCAVMEQRVDQRAGWVSGRRVDDHARRLVHHDQVRVLMDHADRDLLGLHPGLDHLRRHGLDLVIGGHPQAGATRKTVHGHPTRLDPALDLGSGHICELRQDRVEALSRLCLGHVEVQALAHRLPSRRPGRLASFVWSSRAM